MTQKLSFNDVILRLLEFWKEQGCLVWQPYNIQVGAGTMNPATILRVLGPEPWNVVYVEPSIRPDDGRFGDNPNRMQQHHQLQVILQPDPGNPQELYLQSLEAIGIKREEHDIRFVEDNWESPALGAWGLGWEVWLDGQEITQFTYFQQAGSLDLDPVAVEITYGLDRIVTVIQDVDSVWDMEFGAGVGYDQALLQSEIEHCHYYFHVADVDALKLIYEGYEREASRCLEAGLVAPAHDYNLKCSHLFNVMDTRGAVGVTERANYFKRMRNMAREISKAYIAQREKLGFPMLAKAPAKWQAPPLQTADPIQLAQTEFPHTFVLEIGSEELPPDDVTTAVRQLQTAVPALLHELRIPHDSVEVFGTPRRLAVIVQNMAGKQTDLQMEVTGPPAERAFDTEGKPTKAAEGFARSRGLEVSALRIKEEGGKRYVSAEVFEQGRPTAAVLADKMPSLIAGIKFPKSMRWNGTNISYSRPLRWLVALYGPDVVPFAYAGVASGRLSRGLRPAGSPAIWLDEAENYLSIMAAHGIVVSADKRAHIIASVAKQTAAELEGTIPDDTGLLAEVTNLVERPTVFVGQFEDKFLVLPDEVLVAVMRKHQRYFPVYGADGKLLPRFIGVRNGDAEHLDKVVHGNEQVIRARFADADFFFRQDRERPLAEFIPDLAKLTFQAELGSMLDKTKRLEALVPQVGQMLGLDETQLATAARAAHLAKADLATSMVVEMTSLQGVMGAQYALASGEDAAVGQAISQQYEAISTTKPALALALADRLDSLLGLFAVGLAPKGSNDPFALRRAAIHLIENLLANEQAFDLRLALRHTAAHLPVAADVDVQKAVLGFIADRLQVILQEKGLSATTVRAVLAEQAHNPFGAAGATAVLAEAQTRPDWEQLLDAYARCVRITRTQATQYALRPEAFGLAEQGLLAAYQQAKDAQAANPTMGTFIGNLALVAPAITAFFEGVLVMDEDAAVRENRLALLQGVAGLAKGMADLAQLEGF
ncbi:MAG: glycine--tRNA ligase subunit beta [Chloroflexi bacterium]|nr:glycine--tRNA ligase subunit beta [Chloroflexota bacterium]